MWTPEYIPEGCPPSSSVTLHFNPTIKNNSKIEMIWTDGGIRPSHPDLIPPNEELAGAGGNNGVMMIGEKGIITTDVYGMNPKLYKNGTETINGSVSVDNSEEPEFGHQRKWIDACKAGFNSEEHKSLTSSFDYSGPLTETVLMGNIAIKSYLLRKESNNRMNYYARKKLLWDGDNMRITNMDEANQFVGRDYRNGWEI
jgi:hypothetical protein